MYLKKLALIALSFALTAQSAYASRSVGNKSDCSTNNSTRYDANTNPPKQISTRTAPAGINGIFDGQNVRRSTQPRG